MFFVKFKKGKLRTNAGRSSGWDVHSAWPRPRWRFPWLRRIRCFPVSLTNFFFNQFSSFLHQYITTTHVFLNLKSKFVNSNFNPAFFLRNRLYKVYSCIWKVQSAKNRHNYFWEVYIVFINFNLKDNFKKHYCHRWETNLIIQI